MIHHILWLLVIVIILWGLLYLKTHYQIPGRWFQRIKKDKFNQQDITGAFISAIPTLTPEMNLGIATAKQTEVFERKDNRKILGYDLGTNIAEMKVPVTYRYRIPLYGSWKLEIVGKALKVRAPQIQPSLPIGIHTDEIQQHSIRGWCRFGTGHLLDKLNHDLTPTLERYAADPRRMDLVRETCRLSVGKFIKRWLESEDRWGKSGFNAIIIQFGDEPSQPSQPTVHSDFQ